MKNLQNITHYILEYYITKEGFEITKFGFYIPNKKINLNLFMLELVHC
jgi:hypothetical protein